MTNDLATTNPWKPGPGKDAPGKLMTIVLRFSPKIPTSKIQI